LFDFVAFRSTSVTIASIGDPVPQAKKHAVETGELHTGDITAFTDSWDGPRFRLPSCGVNDFRTSPAPHAMFMDAMETAGCWEFVLSGTIYYRLGAERYRVQTGQALVTRRPDPGWMLRPVKGVPVQTLWIGVRGDLALKMFDFLHLKFGQIQTFAMDSEVVRLARRLVELAVEQPHRPSKFWSEQTFHWLNSWWQCAEESHPPRINLALEAIGPSRLMTNAPHSVKDFAAEMGYTRAYLTQKLSQQWKRSPGRVLREVRLEHAASMLRSTRRTIAEIARKVGYSTPASFSRAFLRQYKQSPRQYRRANR
jgi:AraC-like DNA-binding protein